MAEFSNQFHVVAMQEPKVIEEWEKIYESPKVNFQIYLVEKAKKQLYKIS